MANKIDNIETFIKQKNIFCYGSKISSLPDMVFNKSSGRVVIFSSEKYPDLSNRKNGQGLYHYISKAI